MPSFLPSPMHPVPNPRRAVPRVDPVTLPVPGLPPELAGLRILHLSDPHVRRRCRRLDQLAGDLRGVEFDLLVLTGDLMNRPGDEAAARGALERLLAAVRPRFGAVGVHGNHDSDALRGRLDRLPVRWLDNRAWAHPDLPLTMLGVGCAVNECSAPRGDLLAAVMHESAAADRHHHAGNGRPPRIAAPPLPHLTSGAAREAAGSVARSVAAEPRAAVADHAAGGRMAAPPLAARAAAEASPPHRAARFRILLAHVPTWLIPAAAFGLPLVLSGHTHGGQVRPPGCRPLLNATPGWPRHLSAGILRHRDTLAVISRGLGESGLKHLRLFCPPHAPLITLQRAEQPTPPVDGPRCIRRW